MNPRNPFILGSNVKIMSHKNIAGVGLHCCECWLLQVSVLYLVLM